LHLANPWWNASLVGKAINWPVGIGAQGNAGVAGKIQTTPDAIGYVELAYTVQNNMKVAQIKNHDGQWVAPTSRRPRPPRRPWRVRRAPEATGPTCRSWISQGPRATRSRP